MRKTGIQNFPLFLSSLVLPLCFWLILFQGSTMVFTDFTTLFMFSDLTLEELLLMLGFN